jgi:hypothetical protein
MNQNTPNIKSQNLSILKSWRLYKSTWIFLEESEEKRLSTEEANALLKEQGLMVRNTYDFDTKEETSFWFIVKDHLEDISKLPFSARRNIRRALRFYNIKKINLNEFSEKALPIINSAQKSYKVKSKVTSKKEFDKEIEQYKKDDNKEFWIVERKSDNEAVAIAVNTIKKDSCEYDTMRCKADALKDRTYPYYGLIYEMNNHYLGERKLRYVNDGSRTITEHSNIQDFLIHNFGFRKAYCRLKIHYKWWFNVVIKILFPFRNSIMCKNIKAIFKMEEYSKQS